jgi:hypothetical protein
VVFQAVGSTPKHSSTLNLKAGAESGEKEKNEPLLVYSPHKGELFLSVAARDGDFLAI